MAATRWLDEHSQDDNVDNSNLAESYSNDIVYDHVEHGCAIRARNMSSFLFYPSPPSAQSNLIFPPSSLTPQAHRTSPFNPKKANLFTPQTPSPLRTSRNANLMRTPDETTKQGKQWQNDWSDENEHSKTSTTLSEPPSSPLAHTNASMLQNNAYPRINDDITNTTSIFSEHFSPQPNSTAQQSRASHFQQRARESSPSAQVASHVRGARDSRKQLFLGRLRNKRSEERDERGLTQLQRMDYLRDMQERQRDFELEGAQYHFQEPDLVDAEMEVELSQLDGYAVGEQPSPTEERELEELVNYLQPGSQLLENDDYMFDGDDEDFDEVLALMQPSGVQDFGEGIILSGQANPVVTELHTASAASPPNDVDMDTS